MKTDLAAIHDVTAQLAALRAAVPLDDRAPEREMRPLRGYAYVTSEAMRAAVAVIADHADDLPLADAAAIADRLAYVDAMNALAAEARDLARRAERSAIKQRGEAGREVVAMYAALKAMAKYCARARPAVLRMRGVLVK
jgi:hypothetical protein